MVGISTKPGFLARAFLEMAFRTPGPALLQALAQGMMALARLLNGLSAECLALAIGSQLHDTQINSERSLSGGKRRGWNFKGDCQVEGPVAVEQVGLSFDAPHTGLLITSDQEWHEDPARKRQEGDGSPSLKGHDPFIVDESTLWSKSRLDALVSFVGFTRLTDAADSQLSGKLVGCTQLAVDQFLQFKLVGCLFRKGDRSHIIGSLIECMHGVKQGLSLFRCKSEFQEQSLFHRTIVHPLIEIVTGLSPRRRAIHPPLESLSFTHILQTDFVKEPGKTIAIVEIDITSALAIPLSSDFPKMWVRIRLESRGLLARFL